MPGIIEERAQKVRDALDSGLTPLEAGAIAYPEVAPGMAEAHAQATPSSKEVDASGVSTSLISAAMSQDGAAQNVAEGYKVPKGRARNVVWAGLAGLPSTENPVPYDRLDKFMTVQNRNFASRATDMFMGGAAVKGDFELMLETVGFALRRGQQGLFGTMIGESPSAIAERLFPVAVINTPEGEQQKKGLVPLATKGFLLSMLGHMTALWNSGMPSPGGQVMIKKAAQTVQPILQYDYNANQLTGLEVIEQLQYKSQADSKGDVTGFDFLPDPGTPERGAYDQKVSEYAAQNYAALMDRQPGTWDLSMGAVAIGGAVLDFFVDPLLWTSDAPRIGVELLRKIPSISSTARVTAGIGLNARRLEELSVASRDAEEWVKSAAAKHAASPDENTLLRLTHARKNFARIQAALNTNGGPQEAVHFSNLPKIRPEHVTEVGNSFLSAPLETRLEDTKAFISSRVKKLRDERKALENQLEGFHREGAPTLFTHDQATGKSETEIMDKIAGITEEENKWRQTGEWWRSRANIERKTGNALNSEAFFRENISKQKPYAPTKVDIPAVNPDNLPEGQTITEARRLAAMRAIQDNINRGLAQGAPQGEILQWQRAFSDVAEGRVGGTSEAVRSGLHPKQILKDDLVETRKKSLSQSPEPILDHASGNVDQLMQRVAYGPDEAEAAGEAARIVAAGGEIDDITYYGMPLGMFNTSYGLQPRPFAGTEGRALSTIKKPIREIQGSFPEFSAENSGTRFSLHGVNYDQVEGVGATPMGQEINYKGFTTTMKPSEFLSLNPGKRSGESAKVLKKEIVGGGPVAAPFITVELDAENNVWKITGHEGRSRAEAIKSLTNDREMPVQVHVRAGSDVGARNSAKLFTKEELSLPIMADEKAAKAGMVVNPKTRVAPAVEGMDKSLGLPKHLENPVRQMNEYMGKDAYQTVVEAAKWQQTMGEKMSDFWAKGLHPKSWNLRPTGLVYKMREEMRMLQSVAPRLYTRVNDAQNSYHFEVQRMNSIFGRELKTLGVHKMVGANMVVDQAATERFFHLMNMDVSKESYISALGELTEAQRLAISNIRQEMDFLGDKLGISMSDRTIEGYITHVYDPNVTKGGARPPEFEGAPVTGRVFNPYMIERTGSEGFTPDISMALDFYGRAAARKLHVEPVLQDLEFMSGKYKALGGEHAWKHDYIDAIIENMKGKPSKMGGWVDRTIASINARFGAMGAVDKGAKAVGKGMRITGKKMEGLAESLDKVPGMGHMCGPLAGRGIRITLAGSEMEAAGLPVWKKGATGRTAMGVTALSYASVLGGSGRYFPMAVATALATTGGRYGLFRSAAGIFEEATDLGQFMAKQAGVGRMWPKILGDQAYVKMGRLASEMPSLNGVTVVGPSITATENLIRGWTFHACVGDLMRKGGWDSWDEVAKAGMTNRVIHEAARTTEEVNHLFGLAGKPAEMVRISKSGSSMATQFLSFIPKQTEELLSQAMRNPGHIGQYMMISGYIQRAGAKAGLDLSDYVGFGYLPKSPEEATSISVETMASLLAAGQSTLGLFGNRPDPVETTKRFEDLVRNFENFIPFSVALQRAMGNYETLRTGKKFRGWKLVENVDLGRFKWDEHKSFIDNYLNIPKGLMSTTGDPAHPTELIGELMGLNTVQSRLEQHQYSANLTALSRRQKIYNDLADELEVAVDNHNFKRFNELYSRALKDGMVSFDLEQVIGRQTMEKVLPRLIRQELYSAQNTIDGLLQDQKQRAIFSMRFH